MSNNSAPRCRGSVATRCRAIIITNRHGIRVHRSAFDLHKKRYWQAWQPYGTGQHRYGHSRYFLCRAAKSWMVCACQRQSHHHRQQDNQSAGRRDYGAGTRCSTLCRSPLTSGSMLGIVNDFILGLQRATTGLRGVYLYSWRYRCPERIRKRDHTSIAVTLFARARAADPICA